MSELILHEYPLSPFSEKVRRVLAHKGVAYRRVEQPMVLPKPKLLPLTGGYRRIPVLQVGADVYCDTQLIVRVLERLHPEPSVLPPESESVATMVADWADHRVFFWAVLPVFGEILPTLPAEFLADRAAMSPALTREGVNAAAPHALSQLRVALDWIDRAVRDRPFVVGQTFTVADAACFHPVWFLRNSEKLFSEVEKRRSLVSWFKRIEAIRGPDVRSLDADEAIEIAKRATSSAAGEADDDGSSFRVGDLVSVAADDYGTESITGILVRATSEGISLRRRSPETGDVVVHFPRIGYRIGAATPSGNA